MNKARQATALIIWWCEGTKKRKDKPWKNAYLRPIEVTNCNPQIIKIFVDYLIQDLKVEITKLKGQIQIHEGDNQQEIERFWEQLTGIPRNQFNKTIVRKKGNKPGKTLGTFKVRTYSKILFERMSDLLEVEIHKANSGSSSDG